MHSLEKIISINEKAAREQISRQDQQIKEAIRRLKLLQEKQLTKNPLPIEST